MPEGQSAQAKHAEAALTEAMQLHQRGDFAAADRLYAMALQYDPVNAKALRLQGILAREDGEIEKSLALLQRAANNAPEQTAPLNELALSQMVAGHFTDAEFALRQALQLNPKDQTALTNLGALLQHRGHVAGSINCYSELLEQYPDDIEVRCNLAKALIDAGETAAALSACDIAIERSGLHPYTLAIKGAVLTDIEHYGEARQLLTEATEQMPDDDMALVNLALCLDQLHETEAALSALEQSLESNPANARAIADMANCLLKLNDSQAAIGLCEQFLSEYPGESLVVGSYALALAAAGENAAADELTNSKLIKTFEIEQFANKLNIGELNAALAKQVLADSSLLMNPVSKSTTGGAQTGELDLALTPELTKLRDCFAASVQTAKSEYLMEYKYPHPVVAAATESRFLRTWGTVLDPGGKQVAHMHPLGWLSAVYYVQIPDQTGQDDPHSGALLFGPAPARFSQTSITSIYHTPRPGELVIFPSWFWHQTVPFQSGKQRISIAFDVVPRNALRML